MTRRQLIAWSAARDALDWLVIGQVPPFNWLLDIPILCMHLKFAGPPALIGLIELVPVVGMFPFFTTAALSYPEPEAAKEAAASTPSPALPAPKETDGRLAAPAAQEGEIVEGIEVGCDSRGGRP